MPWPKGVPHPPEMVEKMRVARAKNYPAAEVRFWSLIDKKGDDDCWLWQGFCLLTGYGRFSAYGKTVYAHRFSYELHCGPIPEGNGVYHHCDVRGCCNPKHLFSGVQADNIADMRAKGRGFDIPARKGEDNSGAKLTAAQVIDIRRRHAAKEAGYGTLAKEYGVNRSLIASVVKRRAWRHLSDGQAEIEA